MPNVTINIKNCGCCPGGIHIPGSGQGTGSQWDGLGDPNSPSGPPDGYSTPEGTLEDRQCKMAVWLYSWISETVDMLGNTVTGGSIITTVRLVAGNSLLSPLIPFITAGVIFVMGLIITPGLDPGDAVAAIFAYAIAQAVVSQVESINTALVTQPIFVLALPIIEANQDAIICRLSTASTAILARDKLGIQLQEIGLDSVQRAIIMAFLPNQLFTMLFFTADWWPSFDDDVLSEIATTCCGDVVGGDPVGPFSTQSCQAANWIVNQLVDIFTNAATVLNDSYYDVNPFNDDKANIYTIIDGNLEIGAKAKGLMTSYPAFVAGLTEIFYDQIVLGSSLIIDPGFNGLATYIDDNRSTLVPGLQGEADASAAFTYLYADLSAWIDAEVTDIDHQVWMKQTLAAIITPKVDPDFMDLLFIQDVGLLGYPSEDCAPPPDNLWVFTSLGACAPGGYAGELLDGGYSGLEATLGATNVYWSCNQATPIPAIYITALTNVIFTSFSTTSSSLRYWADYGANWSYTQIDPTIPLSQQLTAGGLYILSDDEGDFEITFTMEPV